MAFWFIPAIIAGGYIAKKLFEDEKPRRRSSSYDDTREEQERERKKKARKDFIKTTKERFQNLYHAELEEGLVELERLGFGGLAPKTGLKLKSCSKLNELAAESDKYKKLISNLEGLKNELDMALNKADSNTPPPPAKR